MSVTPDTTRRRWLPRCRYPAACVAGLLAAPSGCLGGVDLRRSRPHAEPLRREGAPGRRPARLRQHHAGMAADRSRLAPAAPPAQSASRCRWTPFYRTGASAIAMSMLAFALAVFAATRIVIQVTGIPAAAARSARDGPRPQSERAVPAGDADDRAAAPRSHALAVSLALIDWVEQSAPRLDRRRRDLRSPLRGSHATKRGPVVSAAIALAGVARSRRRNAAGGGPRRARLRPLSARRPRRLPPAQPAERR